MDYDEITEKVKQIKDDMRKAPFTKIPNAILNLILAIDITKNEMKVLLIIARFTYGCHVEYGEMQKKDLTLSGVPMSSLKEVVDKLFDKKIIVEGKIGYKINKNIWEWKVKSHTHFDLKQFKYLIHINAKRGKYGKNRVNNDKTSTE